jgi:hypothetical protein
MKKATVLFVLTAACAAAYAADEYVILRAGACAAAATATPCTTDEPRPMTPVRLAGAIAARAWLDAHPGAGDIPLQGDPAKCELSGTYLGLVDGTHCLAVLGKDPTAQQQRDAVLALQPGQAARWQATPCVEPCTAPCETFAACEARATALANALQLTPAHAKRGVTLDEDDGGCRIKIRANGANYRAWIGCGP